MLWYAWDAFVVKKVDSLCRQSAFLLGKVEWLDSETQFEPCVGIITELISPEG